jgi:hypothetical protein
MRRPGGRRIAMWTGSAAIIVLGVGVYFLWDALILELAYRDLRSDDLARRQHAATRLRESGWTQCISRILKADCVGPLYHRFLREASLIVPPLLLDRDFDEVQGLLTRQGFPLVKSSERGSELDARFLLKKSFFSSSPQPSLDLYLLLSAAPPRKVKKAEIALIIDFGNAFDEAVQNLPVPNDTVLNEVLRKDQVKKAGSEWPILEDIQISYSYHGKRHDEYNPSGFNVQVKFAAWLTEKIAEKRMYFFMESELDPLRTRTGKTDPNRRFTPLDSFGEVEGGGSNEWWKGDKETMERNKKKYLKEGRSF